jgi:putative hemolysin
MSPVSDPLSPCSSLKKMEIIIIVLLILLNGIFSMSEIAIVSSRKTRLDLSAKRGNKAAQAALDIAHAPNKFLSTVQIGITLIGILTGLFGGETMTEDVKVFFEKFDFFRPYAATIAVIVVVVFITFLSLVFGELVPKRIGLSNPEGIAKLVARPMNILSIITMPFVWLLTFTGDLIVRILGIKPKSDSQVTEEEIKAIIQEGTEGGAVQEIEQDIMERVLILGDRKVVSLMTNRNDLVFLGLNQSRENIEKIVSEDLHSMYPVYDQNPDNLKGVVLLKDLFLNVNKADFELKKYLREPVYLSENTSVYKALQFFKEKSVSYGLVTDEYGITKGVITLNDVLEALVGSVNEFYKEDYMLEQRADGSYIVDGQFPFHDFLMQFEMDDYLEEYDFNTLGGLILDITQKIPKEGEIIKWKNFEFEIIDMDNARIDKILVKFQTD